MPRTLAGRILPSLALLVAGVAHAELDSFGVGDGHDQALSVTSATGQVVNVYAQLTTAVAAGATQLQVGTAAPAAAAFNVGDLVLLIQSTGLTPEPDAGDQTPIDLSLSTVGVWELGRLLSVGAGGALTLTHPLVNAFAATTTQVIAVPEYTTVTVAAGALLTGIPWNGSVGGVAGFLAQGAVANAGTIDLSGGGFQGGALVNALDSTDYYGCTQIDVAAGTPPVGEWAMKGEGIVPAAFGDLAMGNVANGAGGGDCDNSGGGGGANAGAGGQGGMTWQNNNTATPNGDDGRAVGGLGGAPLLYSLVDQLTFGGGGGAGQENDSVGTAGAPGGGAIFIRAAQLSGTGTISANGASVTAVAGNDGAGGGGGGGSIYLRLTGTAACGSVSAQGGAGGNIKYTAGIDHGPGGGGGGGRVMLQATDSSSCPISVAAGLAGLFDGTDVWGAGPTPATQATLVGTIETPPAGGFPPPTITSPTNGATVTTQEPTITGTAADNSTVDVFVNGVLVGTATTDANGNYSFTPTNPLPQGTTVVQVEAVGQAAYSPTTTFTIAVPTTGGSTGGSGASTGTGTGSGSGTGSAAGTGTGSGTGAGSGTGSAATAGATGGHTAGTSGGTSSESSSGHSSTGTTGGGETSGLGSSGGAGTGASGSGGSLGGSGTSGSETSPSGALALYGKSSCSSTGGGSEGVLGALLLGGLRRRRRKRSGSARL